MPRTAPTSVAEFLATLPPERREHVERVRGAIRNRLPPGFEEAVARDMIVYQVPLARYSTTYNGRPLWLAALAAPKSYLTLHLMPVYGSPAVLKKLQDGFKAAGKKLDIGKACIRYKHADDLALDAIGDVIASVSVDGWVAVAEAARTR